MSDPTDKAAPSVPLPWLLGALGAIVGVLALFWMNSVFTGLERNSEKTDKVAEVLTSKMDGLKNDFYTTAVTRSTELGDLRAALTALARRQDDVERKLDKFLEAVPRR